MFYSLLQRFLQVPDWQADRGYHVNELVVYVSIVYRCTIANTDAVFTPANWMAVGPNISTKVDKVAANEDDVWGSDGDGGLKSLGPMPAPVDISGKVNKVVVAENTLWGSDGAGGLKAMGAILPYTADLSPLCFREPEAGDEYPTAEVKPSEDLLGGVQRTEVAWYDDTTTEGLYSDALRVPDTALSTYKLRVRVKTVPKTYVAGKTGAWAVRIRAENSPASVLLYTAEGVVQDKTATPFQVLSGEATLETLGIVARDKLELVLVRVNTSLDNLAGDLGMTHLHVSIERGPAPVVA